MFEVITKMLLAILLYIGITAILWKKFYDTRNNRSTIILIGIIYGMLSIFSTHAGVDYVNMTLNVRDMGPLISGLFFNPISGLIAGFIGGIERYIVGTYFGVGSYTTIACSVSTCLAGILAYVISVKLFYRHIPTPMYALFVGIVIEVFHMYAVLVTHRDDANMAFSVVNICAPPMIIFTAVGMLITSLSVIAISGKWERYFKAKDKSEIPISFTFQKGLFVVMFSLIVLNIAGMFTLQNEMAYQNADTILSEQCDELIYWHNMGETFSNEYEEGTYYPFCYINQDGRIEIGKHRGETINEPVLRVLQGKVGQDCFEYRIFGEDAICKVAAVEDENILLSYILAEDAFWYRNSQVYEMTFAYTTLFAVVFLLITIMLNQIVVKNIDKVNASLNLITSGNLDEVVNVRNSSEFNSLSDDINETVTSLKGYIQDVENRIEQELLFAETIQMSSLPRNFIFPSHTGFELYALMDPAKQVGGDFYDFFFVDVNKIAFVIADVSGKGIPASLFMMRAKTAIRSYAQTQRSPKEILIKTNASLNEGNDAQMFVTAWIGILNLSDGKMVCANAGHEYPILYRNGESASLFKDQHSLPLAAIDELNIKEYEITFNPGDIIFVYTDGVPEAINKDKEQYSTDRLLKVINANISDDITTLLLKSKEDVDEFADGVDQFDDITMLGFKFITYEKG